MILCVFGRIYCTAFIGGIKNETVFRPGPFSIVRNPLYVFSFIGIVGIGLESGMLTVLALLVGGFLVYYPRVVAREEAFLLNKFGDEYQRYLNEVPRWIPNFSLCVRPEEITVRPKFLKNAMVDGLVFFLALPLFEIIEAIHDLGWLNFIPNLP